MHGYFFHTLNSRQFRIVMSKDARNWGFAVVTWSFVDLSLLMNYVRHDFKSFSLAHCFTDQVLIRCLNGEALTLLLVVPLASQAFLWLQWAGLLSGCGGWTPHCSGFSCWGKGFRHVGSVIVAPRLRAQVQWCGRGLGRFAAHGIFSDQGLNLCLLQADSQPLDHQGSPMLGTEFSTTNVSWTSACRALGSSLPACPSHSAWSLGVSTRVTGTHMNHLHRPTVSATCHAVSFTSTSEHLPRPKHGPDRSSVLC